MVTSVYTPERFQGVPFHCSGSVSLAGRDRILLLLGQWSFDTEYSAGTGKSSRAGATVHLAVGFFSP